MDLDPYIMPMCFSHFCSYAFSVGQSSINSESESVSRSVVSDSATAWTVDHQTPLSMGFPRQEHWSGLPFPPPGDLPNPGIKLTSLASPALAGEFFTTAHTGSSPNIVFHLVGRIVFIQSFLINICVAPFLTFINNASVVVYIRLDL